jgi:putative component of membrane protein insertase Oxa1/YidC/SpoIIIJ protein YidD
MILKSLLSLSLILLSLGASLAQAPSDDLDLLRGKVSSVADNNGYVRAGNDKKVMEVHQPSFIAKYNPVTLLLKGTMYTYQHVISPQLSRSCPYEITCSNFSKQSIKTYGIVKGVFLSADRILRCNRIGILDVHPLDFNDLTGTISDSPSRYR